MKVLLVDPDMGRMTTLAQALGANGVDVSTAPSASFALTMLEWNKQDAVVSRARLGDMDGHELCTIVRSDPSTKDIRFILVVGPGENAPAQTAAAGVDMLLPDALSNATIVSRVVNLLRRQVEEAPAARAATPKPLLAAPPRTPMTPVATPPSPVVVPAVPSPAPPPPVPQPVAATLPPVPPPAATTPPPVPPPVAATPPPIAVEPSVAEAIAPVAPSPSSAPAPVLVPPTPMPSMSGLDSVGTNGAARTFQGSLGVLEIEELTQAIAVGNKTGRLVIVLSTGGGLIVFDGGRVTHAEFGGDVGEPAFGALVAASHRERGGKFCFIPVHRNELRSQPKTIDRGVDQLLLDVAKAMDEEKRA